MKKQQINIWGIIWFWIVGIFKVILLGLFGTLKFAEWFIKALQMVIENIIAE